MKDKYKTLIISCWVVLLCCFIVKLLGGNFFEIVCENEKFIRFCKFIDGNILKYVISFIMYMTSAFIYMLAVVRNKISNKRKIIAFVLYISLWTIKLIAYNLPIIATIVEFIGVIGIPILMNKTYWKMSLIGCGLNLLFQFISLITKNVELNYVDETMFIAIIFNIDYYIMIILFYLYRTKEYNENGINRIFLFRFRRQRKH